MTQTVSWVLVIKSVNCLCGENREYLSTELSTEKACFSSNPHLGEGQRRLPYMGGTTGGKFQPEADFSTASAVYPQIIASYPQLETPGDGYGGFPCPYM